MPDKDIPAVKYMSTVKLSILHWLAMVLLSK